DSFDIYNVNKDTDDRFDTLVAFETGTGAARRACVLALHRNPPPFLGQAPAITITDITPAAFGVPSAKKLVFADLESDNDPCPGLVRQDAGANALTYYDGSQSSNAVNCALAATATTLPSLAAPPGTVIVGRAPVRPTVLSAASDGLVTNEGVYPYFPNGYLFITGATFAQVYATTRNTNRVANGDFDGDGNVDLVLGAAGEQDLDVLFRAPSQPGFNLVRIDTTSEVTSITTGDFDGNNIADIAYTEDLGDHQRLLVAFGTPDRPLPPTSVGVFTDVLDVSRMGLPDSVDYLGLADDLLVLQSAGPGQTSERLTLLHGSPQRTLLSYFDPREDSLRADTLFRGAIIGHFVTGTTTPELADVIAVAAPAPGATAGTGTQTVRAYRVPNTPNGLDGSVTTGVSIDGLADCSLAGMGKLCLDLATYVAFPTGTNHDVVIGIDRANAAVMVDPWASTITASPLATLTAIVPQKTTAQSLQIGDIDGDGAPELIATFAPAADDSKGAVIVCTMQNGVATKCEDYVPAIIEAAAAAGTTVKNCFDAAPARISYRDPTVTPDASMDLAVACRGEGTSIFRMRRGPDGVVADRLATTGATVSAIRAGDVTGDHVDDLLLLEGDTVTSLLVYPQCTSREAATCKLATTSASEESP
ncbi:MAG TPA: VCBS repeat-containing protein, partial [Kofleriaceae bacterium]|nr:VCBS repeat-containing protein [Kofleriaceae bacterium]